METKQNNQQNVNGTTKLTPKEMAAIEGGMIWKQFRYTDEYGWVLRKF